MILSGDLKTLEWGCSKCKGDEFADGDDKRKIRNCDSESNPNVAWAWMPELRRCPMSQIDNEAWECIAWWSEYKEFNALPWGGSDLMDQPNFVIDVFVLCSNISKVAEEERAKRWRAQER
tara:strand:+ start:4135 stop:4494 length:360 start_codon:yes stop_codon:yes gene_type:complete